MSANGFGRLDKEHRKMVAITINDTHDKVTCRICGASLGQLSVHISAKHQIKLAEYQAQFPGAPVISPAADAAKKAGAGKKKGEPAKPSVALALTKPTEEEPAGYSDDEIDAMASEQDEDTSEEAPAPKPAKPAKKESTMAKAEKVAEPAESEGSEWAAPVATKLMKIGVAKIPVWGGWSEADQALVPVHDPNHQLDIELFTEIAVGLELCENIFITGPTGSGKTTGLKELACVANWPVTRLNLNIDTRAADLIGDMVVEIDEETGHAVTRWQDGPLVTAMRRGHIFLIDEIDAANPGVHFVLQRVTERSEDPLEDIKSGRPHATLLLPTGELVKAAPTFRLVATANTVGSGDMSGDYAGTNVMNQSTLRRWGIKIRLDYPNAERWKAMLKAKGGATEAIADQLYKVCDKVNKGKRDGQCRVMISPATSITWARLSVKFGNIRKAAELAVLNGIDGSDADRQFVSDIIKNLLGV
jgi:cobaltochelatase CobS